MFDFDRKHFLGIAGALALAIGAAGTASAAPVAGTISAGNDALGAGSNNVYAASAVHGWFKASLHLVGGPATIQISYLGFEAENANTFNWFGGGAGFSFATNTGGATSTIFKDANAPGFADQSRSANAGLLGFSFTSGSPGGTGTVTNANNPGADHLAPSNEPNFFISFGPDFGTAGSPTSSGQIAYLWFDDSVKPTGSDDDNHDDFVVRFKITDGPGTFSTIPLPAAAWLILAGIGGLGLVARRRKATEA